METDQSHARRDLKSFPDGFIVRARRFPCFLHQHLVVRAQEPKTQDRVFRLVNLHSHGADRLVQSDFNVNEFSITLMRPSFSQGLDSDPVGEG